MCSPRKSDKNFLIFTFYESKQMLLTQDLSWSLGRSTALLVQLQRQTDLLLCTTNCFLQWDRLQNMAVRDLAFYYTLYLCFYHTLPMIGFHIFEHWGRSLCSKKCAQLVFSRFWLQNWCVLKFQKSCQFFETLSFSLYSQISWSWSTFL